VPAERVLRIICELGRATGHKGLVAGQVVDIQSENKEVRGAGEADGRMGGWIAMGKR
jgi:hypothetical protein